MDRVNWGIIGLGNVAFKIAEAIDKTKIAKIGGIASKSEIKLQFFKDKFKLEKQNCFNNYEKLLDNKNIDLVYIALPNSLHYKWMIKCIEKKHNVLVEKPATINFSEMKNIKDNLNKKDIFFSEAFMYRFHPQIQKIVDLIEKKAIGKLQYMNSNFGVNIMTKKNIFGLNKKKKNR